MAAPAVAPTPPDAELTQTEFPPDEHPDPVQDPRDLGKGGAR